MMPDMLSGGAAMLSGVSPDHDGNGASGSASCTEKCDDQMTGNDADTLHDSSMPPPMCCCFEHLVSFSRSCAQAVRGPSVAVDKARVPGRVVLGRARCSGAPDKHIASLV
jgi:hypothetical protein